MSPEQKSLSRREFIRDTAVMAAGAAVAGGVVELAARHCGRRRARRAGTRSRTPAATTPTWSTAGWARPACGSRPSAWAGTGSGSTR